MRRLWDGSMHGAWDGGKGSVRRKATPTEKQATAKELGCGWCGHWLAYRKICLKSKGVRCQKLNERK